MTVLPSWSIVVETSMVIGSPVNFELKSGNISLNAGSVTESSTDLKP